MTTTLDESPSTETTRARDVWGLSAHGVRTVAALELRQRVRSTRWVVALIVWVVVIGAITVLISGAIGQLFGTSDSSLSDEHGALLYSAVVFLVLGLGLLVTPTLSSTSVNGDRAAGTLATLQVTLLTPAEIAFGKVLASWVAACAFLVASTPFLAFAIATGSTPWVSLLRVVLIVSLLLASVCAIGLGMSALVARGAGSTVLTFVVVAATTFLAPLLFGLTYPAVSHDEQVQVWSMPASWTGEGDMTCEWTTQQRSVGHTERTWWLLAINPFVITADGAGTPASSSQGASDGDALGGLRDVVRQVRSGPTAGLNECWNDPDSFPSQDAVTAPVWPWGLAANLLLGAAGLVVAIRRLTVPRRTLPRGTRVA
ncbi:ABC transporter permease [Cellulomonas composti]|uniref:ABC transporter permease n=1 Tax=Cellulomonas composti TaxID=266130 RepID=A0A511J7I7_9CELL|nr:ABC transporter permease subunit [Cellulomonas composti]GEL93955.1 ABC transporter permease [Cellulomonas composti]